MPDGPNVAEIYIKIDGSLIGQADMDQFHQAEVDSSIHLPAAAALTFYDRDLKFVDDEAKFDVGKQLEISVKPNGPNSTAKVVFKGVIAAIEPEFSNAEAYGMFVIRAYDRSFWLHRGNKSATYQQVKDSDIVSKVCGEAGLSASVTATKVVHEHVYRHNLSDLDFIRQLAARNGYVVLVDDRTVHFKPPDSLNKGEVELEYGVDILEFRPMVSLAAQVNEISAQGWDRKKKALVTGISNTAQLKPTAIGLTQRGSNLAQKASGSSKKLFIADTWDTEADAEASAKAAFNAVSAGDVTGEGVAVGDPRIEVGGRIKVKSVGKRFSGTYLVTRCRHVFQQKKAFETQFWMGGMASGTFASLVEEPQKVPGVRTHLQHGLLTGVVTNLADPENLGRVKVKFPALSEADESFWCPVICAGAGAGRGLMILPDVNDEVIVAFEYGDINRPYVLGGLWNGQDKTPENAITSGSNDIKVYKSAAGHILRFTDKSGGEKIELIDKTGNNLLSIDSASGDITIKANGNLILQATQDVKISGMNIKVEGKGTGAFDVKTKLELKGAIVDVAAQGMTKISGATVMIN